MSISRTLFLPDAAATDRLGAILAAKLGKGDTVLLSGDIGTGKTHLARAIIQAMAATRGLPLIDVPSPTFTLVQTYAFTDIEVWHADLYRLSDPGELFELGLDDALEDAIVLIEWPDRLGLARPDALSMSFTVKDDGRNCVITSQSDRWHDILDCADA